MAPIATLRRRSHALARAARVLLFGSAVAAVASAQTVHVVDAANGPGANFTEVSAAIAAAADGDILLIRTGTYGTPLLVDGKGLTLQSEVGATVTLASIHVQNLGAAQQFGMRGLNWGDPEFAKVIRLTDNLGPVWIEDTVYDFGPFGTATSAVSIHDCATVVLTNNTFVMGSGDTTFSVLACVEAFDSVVAIYGGAVTGASAFKLGGAGVHAFDSQVTLYGLQVTGGAGFADPFTMSPGTGGSALVLNGSAGATAIERIDLQLVAGQGFASGGGAGQTGMKVTRLGTGGTVTAVPHIAHTVTTPSPVRPAENTTITFTGDPGDFAYLAVSADPALLTHLARPLGPLLLSSPWELISFGQLGPATSGNETTATFHLVAPSFSGAFALYMQGVFLGPQGNPSVPSHVALGSVSQLVLVN